MKTIKRQKKIVEILEQQYFISIGDLSKKLDVSQMTIRRDLKVLAEANLIKRTYGGAIPVNPPEDEPGPESILAGTPILRSCNSDVLIITSANPKTSPFLLEGVGKEKIPLIAESTPHSKATTNVGIDDYNAGYDLGGWVAEYAIQNWDGTANVLIWSYNLPNTEARGRGFLAGLNESIPKLGEVISLNPTSRDDIAYQLTRDALEVNDNINVIFAINDNNAWGAIQACFDLGVDPHQTIVIPFGLEGDRIKNALLNNLYCPIGLAMFPEIVGRTCIDAAIAAYNNLELPAKIETPYLLLTRETLQNFYQRNSDGWDFLWDTTKDQLRLPWQGPEIIAQENIPNPNCIGIFLSFPNHEWYQNMIASMNKYVDDLGIDIEILDADQNIKDELLSAKHRIAKKAALELNTGDTVFISGGIVTQFLTEYIPMGINITVITNSTSIFKKLQDQSNITLMSTGGILRRDSKALVGPYAENALQDLRVDKLFLTVSGVSLEFGLSHTEISEVTIKQAMIKSAREVYLLADHTKFEQESFIQIASIEAVDKLITDSGLPAQARLQFNSAGVEVIIT